MRAILIDPFLETITAVDFDGKDIGEALNIGSRPVTTIQMMPTEVLWLDDEGLFQPKQRFWRLTGYGGNLAGYGLIVGSTKDGDFADSRFELPMIKANVQWLPATLRFAGMVTTEEVIDHPVFGPTNAIRRTAEFKDLKEMS